MIRRKGLQIQKLMPTLSFSATCEFWKVIEPSFLCTVHVYYPGFIVLILCLSSQLLPVTLANCAKLQSELKIALNWRWSIYNTFFFFCEIFSWVSSFDTLCSKKPALHIKLNITQYFTPKSQKPSLRKGSSIYVLNLNWSPTSRAFVYGNAISF